MSLCFFHAALSCAQIAQTAQGFAFKSAISRFARQSESCLTVFSRIHHQALLKEDTAQAAKSDALASAVAKPAMDRNRLLEMAACLFSPGVCFGMGERVKDLRLLRQLKPWMSHDLPANLHGFFIGATEPEHCPGRPISSLPPSSSLPAPTHGGMPTSGSPGLERAAGDVEHRHGGRAMPSISSVP